MSLKSLVRSTLTSRPIRPVLRGLPLPERVYRSLHFRDTIEIAVPGSSAGFHTHHHGYQVENDLYWAGFGKGWEGRELRLWTHLAKECQTIFDIGANTGIFSLAAGAVNSTAAIHAFEPMPSVAEHLRANVALNPFDIAVNEAALSSSSGEMTFYLPDSDHAYSATLDPDMARSVGATVEKTVKVLRFDDYVAQAGLERVDLVKIDAERHEPDVMSGFGDILLRFAPLILIEVLDEEMGRRIAPFFAPHGYHHIAIDGRFEPNAGPLGVGASNFLLFSSNRNEMVRSAVVS